MHQDSPTVIRLTRPNDINTITQLDLKCYDYPWPLTKWQETINDNGKNNAGRLVLMEVNKKPGGFALWQIGLDQIARILRFGVLPKYRNKGYGTVLMNYVKVFCQGHVSQPDKIQIIVPHLSCIPGDPENVFHFLNKCGFRATGQVEKDYAYMYGELVEGYYFESELNSVLAS